MFETVVPETHVRRSRRLFYETLPLSLGAHGAVIAGVLLGSIWNVEFPRQSPSLVAVYTLADLPDPPPPPPPPRVMDPAPPTPRPSTAHVAAPPLPQLLEMAPRVIPDLVPKVAAQVPLPEPPPLRNASPEGVAGGQEEGVKGGKLGGEVEGKPHGLVGSVVFPDDGRVYIDINDKLPMEPIEQEPPHYPEAGRLQRLEDSVLVRYVIGKNGRVKDVTILDHAHESMFDDATVNAIKRWYFKPLKRNGKAVEVVHELTVFYQLR